MTHRALSKQTKAQMTAEKPLGPHRNPAVLTRQSPVASGEAQPTYLSIRDALAERIAAGDPGPNQKLPSERELADTYRVARMTARKALAMLEAEGTIFSADRRGYFVSPPRIPYDPGSPVNLMRQLRTQGLMTENIYLGRQLLGAGAWQARHFDSATGEPLALERSVVVVEGRRVVYTEDYLLLDALPGYAERPYVSPMTQNIKRNYDVHPSARSARIRVTVLSNVAAHHLEVSPNTPGLTMLFTQVFEGRVVMVNHCHWLSDAVELVYGEASA